MEHLEERGVIENLYPWGGQIRLTKRELMWERFAQFSYSND